jgi:hypothetical protein
LLLHLRLHLRQDRHGHPLQLLLNRQLPQHRQHFHQLPLSLRLRLHQLLMMIDQHCHRRHLLPMQLLPQHLQHYPQLRLPLPLRWHQLPLRWHQQMRHRWHPYYR